MIKEFRKK